MYSFQWNCLHSSQVVHTHSHIHPHREYALFVCLIEFILVVMVPMCVGEDGNTITKDVCTAVKTYDVHTTH